jgi:hypothetical protein
MKMSSRNLGIIIVIAIIIVAGVALMMHNNPTKIPSPAESASPAGSTSGVSAAYRAQVRSDFINDCIKKVGQARASECSCAADYLRANYSDADLVKLFLQYQASGKVPEGVKTAINSCSSK